MKINEPYNPEYDRLLSLHRNTLYLLYFYLEKQRACGMDCACTELLEDMLSRLVRIQEDHFIHDPIIQNIAECIIKDLGELDD